MLGRDRRAADGGGEREAGGDGGGGGGHEGEVSGAAEAKPVVEDCSDGDSDVSSWTSSEGDGDLADDAVHAGVLASVGVDPGAGAGAGGVAPFGLADPRRHLSPAPTFGNVAVANSTDVQFGNKTFFNGPVTIKQVVYAKDIDGAAATAVPAASSGARVAHVDPNNPAKDGVVAEGVRVTLRPPLLVANGKANGAAAGGSSESVAGGDCCQIPGFHAAAKTGDGDGVPRRWWRRIWKTPKERNMALCGAAAALLLVGGFMSLASALLTLPGRPAGKAPAEPELPKPWETAETNVSLSGKLHMVPRREWLAQPALYPATFLQPPVPYVIVSHSATEACDTQAACTHLIRFMQTFHIESRGWSDIIYNFLVGGDGYVYEGRGWAVVGAHTFGYDNRSIGIDMVGTFTKVLPSQAQMLALRQLIELGVEAGYIAEDYKLLAHCQLAVTESPGARFFEELKTWPHWSKAPQPSSDTPAVVPGATSLR